ncbi:hypothetical protein [Salibacterium aidingense]|uniref:hypothetical protein n=1 Tax=Salibacterium aidingense TaxID=384933 RepID=UPI00041DCBE0|nr:hypothetical protein [Salibacterium aidingense]
MSDQSKVVHHFTEFPEFENKGLEDNGISFPELEQILKEYLLSQPRETMEFKECFVRLEQENNEEVRIVEVTFQDHNMKNYTRLWGSKSNEDGRVLDMKVDAVDLETKEVVYERQLV